MGDPIVTSINIQDIPYKIKGTLYDELGNNTDGGITQKVISDSINGILIGNTTEYTDAYVNTGYIVAGTGAINSSATSYKFTNPIQVSKGNYIKIRTTSNFPSVGSIITKCNALGTYISTLVTGNGTGSGLIDYTYTIEEDCYVQFSAHSNAAYHITTINDGSGIDKLKSNVAAIENEISNINDDISSNANNIEELRTHIADETIDLSSYTAIAKYINENNKWFLNNNNYTGYLIPVMPNRTYVLVGNANYKSWFSLLKNDSAVHGETPSFVDAIEGETKRRIDIALNTEKIVKTPSDASYMWLSKYMGNSSNDTSVQSITIKSSVYEDISENTENINILTNDVTTIKTQINGEETSFNNAFVNEGGINSATLDIDSRFDAYRHTNPIAVSKYDFISMNVLASSNIGMICACDENGIISSVLMTGQSASVQQLYTYTVLESGYVKLCAHNAFIGEVYIRKQSLPDKVNLAVNDISDIKLNIDTAQFQDLRIRLFPEIKLPCVCFQFDNVNGDTEIGNRQVYELFESYGVKGGFGFVTGSRVKTNDHFLKAYADEYMEYHKNGWDIINHGLYTARLDDNSSDSNWLNDEDAKQYIFESKYLLEKWGFIVNGWISFNSAMRASLVNYVKQTHAYGSTLTSGSSNSNTRNGSPCETMRIAIEGRTLATLKNDLDTAISLDKLCVFYCHTNYFGRELEGGLFNIDKVEDLLNYCIELRDAGAVYLDNNDHCYKYFYGL